MATFTVSMLILAAAGSATYLIVTSLKQSVGFRITHLALAIVLFIIATIATGYFHR